MKPTNKQRILEHFRAQKKGSLESVALETKLSASTIYFNLRSLVHEGDLKQGPSEVIHDGRGRAYNRLTWVFVERAKAEQPQTIVQRALASRDAITLAWWGPAC